MKGEGGKRSLWNLFLDPQEEKAGKKPAWATLLLDENADDSEGSSNAAVSFTGDSFFWAMRDLPVTEASKHLLACGTTGSGKSVAIRLFLQSIARRFRLDWEKPEQLIVFDAKGDVVPMLASMGLRPEDENFYILNPFDERSAVWNLGEATQMPAMVRALAALLVPKEERSSAPYFSESGQELVGAVIHGLNAVAGTKWTLRDLLCALDSPEHIRAITRHHPAAGRLAARVLDDVQHGYGVISTVASKVNRFDQVAALWHSNRSGQPFSIEEFLQKPGVLVLGNDPVLRESIWPLNAILLQALSNKILRGTETREPRHWIVLDEFRAMERVDCIHALLNQGRSKGASVLLGIQSVEGLMDLYGEKRANDILGMCASKMFLRAGEHPTAQWASQHFGMVRHVETSSSYSIGSHGNSSTTNYALQERSMFLPSLFLDLPFPEQGGNYEAICDVPSLGETIIARRSFNEVLSWFTKPSSIPAVEMHKEKEAQTFVPWTGEEERRFCNIENSGGRKVSSKKSKTAKPLRPDGSKPCGEDPLPPGNPFLKT